MKLLQLCKKLTHQTSFTVQPQKKLNKNVDFFKRNMRAKSNMNLFTTDQLLDTGVKNA